jgi:hypothetical protein
MDGDYVERLKLHLAAYKREILGVAEDGVYTRNQRAYPHILPREQMWLNALPEIRSRLEEHVRAARPRTSLHNDFHHLNSSQAMALTLFFPWFSSGHAEQFLEALGVEGRGVGDWKFEKILDDGTNLDFWMLLEDKSEIQVEVKLTERQFGSAKADPEHLEKLREIYRPRLTGKIEASVPDAVLLRHYQLMRLISGVNLARADQVFVIAPSGHSSLERSLAAFRALLMPTVLRRLRFVSLESLFALLSPAAAGDVALSTAAMQFTAKYLPRVASSRADFS